MCRPVFVFDFTGKNLSVILFRRESVSVLVTIAKIKGYCEPSPELDFWCKLQTRHGEQLRCVDQSKGELQPNGIRMFPWTAMTMPMRDKDWKRNPLAVIGDYCWLCVLKHLSKVIMVEPFWQEIKKQVWNWKRIRKKRKRRPVSHEFWITFFSCVSSLVFPRAVNDDVSFLSSINFGFPQTRQFFSEWLWVWLCSNLVSSSSQFHLIVAE